MKTIMPWPRNTSLMSNTTNGVEPIRKYAIDIDPALRDWEYDGQGLKRYSDTFELVIED